MYKYETHLHTYPVSRCAKVGVREVLEFYKKMQYDGVFITNHFIDGNINADKSLPYPELIAYYFSDFEEGVRIGAELGIKVFCGVELSHAGTDFLVYGLDKEWFLAHPEIAGMQKSKQLPYFMEHGALVIQAHPYRESPHIDHIRLFPQCVHGVETVNASRPQKENDMAKLYAEHYGLLAFAGSDNHVGARAARLAGMCSAEPILCEADFVQAVMDNKMQTFDQYL